MIYEIVLLPMILSKKLSNCGADCTFSA